MNEPGLKYLSLRCENIGCNRGSVPVVRNVSFKLSSGEAIIILGANGAGKSSLLGAIAGRIPITAGSLQWVVDDEELPKSMAANEISILDHDGAIKPDLTIEENLTFWKKLYNRDTKSIADAIEETGLSHAKYQRAGTLSAGQKRRLSFARIKIANRPVWLLDEPTTSIDEAGKSDITAIIESHLSRGGMAIMATHDPLAINCASIRIG